MLDIDAFLGLFDAFGISYSWLSRSETVKLKELCKNSNLYVTDNKAIKNNKYTWCRKNYGYGNVDKNTF